MFLAKLIFPVIFVSTFLAAQTTNDLNGLVTAAGHYVSNGMSGARDPETLQLSRIAGDNGNPGAGYLCQSGAITWTQAY